MGSQSLYITALLSYSTRLSYLYSLSDAVWPRLPIRRIFRTWIPNRFTEHIRDGPRFLFPWESKHRDTCLRVETTLRRAGARHGEKEKVGTGRKGDEETGEDEKEQLHFVPIASGWLNPIIVTLGN